MDAHGWIPELDHYTTRLMRDFSFDWNQLIGIISEPPLFQLPSTDTISIMSQMQKSLKWKLRLIHVPCLQNWGQHVPLTMKSTKPVGAWYWIEHEQDFDDLVMKMTEMIEKRGTKGHTCWTYNISKFLEYSEHETRRSIQNLTVPSHCR